MGSDATTSTAALVFDEYAAAVYDKDVARLIRIYGEGARVFDMWGSWSYEGRAQWQEAIADWFSSLDDDRVVVEFNEQRVELLGAAALASAFVTYRRVRSDGAEDRAQTNRITWLLRNGSDGWVIEHEHSSAPVDPETGEPQLSR
jgi:ketosteroid isomerase-like protein